MKKWNLIVDVGRCHNSNNCFLSVVDEYGGNEHPGYAAEMPPHGHYWFDIKRKERGQAPVVEVNYLPTTCMHCDDAPCIAAARDDAVRKRPDGIVIIDPEKAKGQKQLVDSCPYGAIWWNEEKDVPQQWIFDAHLLDRGWKEPRPVQACPTGALRSVFMEEAEFAELRERENLEELHPEYATKPRVLYKNLHLFNQCFVAGTIVAEKDGIEDCVKGAIVILAKDGEKIGEGVTDAFGEFKIDRLPAGGGAYSGEILHPEFKTLAFEVELGESLYTGLHRLTPR